MMVEKDGIEPDLVTLVSACDFGGLMERGMMHFGAMNKQCESCSHARAMDILA